MTDESEKKISKNNDTAPDESEITVSTGTADMEVPNKEASVIDLDGAAVLEDLENSIDKEEPSVKLNGTGTQDIDDNEAAELLDELGPEIEKDTAEKSSVVKETDNSENQGNESKPGVDVISEEAKKLENEPEAAVKADTEDQQSEFTDTAEPEPAEQNDTPKPEPQETLETEDQNDETLFDEISEEAKKLDKEPESTAETETDKQEPADADAPEPDVKDDTPEPQDEEKAKLDKDDIAEELENALKNEGATAAEMAPEDETESLLEELGITSEDAVKDSKKDKANLDKEDMPEDIFIEDKAALDSEGMPEDAIPSDKAKLDIDDIPKAEEKEAKEKKAPVKTEDKETDHEAALSLVQKLIKKAKEASLVKIAVILSSVTILLILCLVLTIMLIFSGAEKDKTEDIFAETEPVIEKKMIKEIPLIENYKMKTFVIPMIDPEKGTCFFKADFILTFNKVNVRELEKHTIKIREAIYEHFKNKNPEIVIKKIKKSEQIFKLKNTLNILFKKDAVKSITLVNDKIV